MGAEITSPFETSPFWVELSGEIARAPQALGAAVDAILAGRATSLVFDLGEHAVDPRLLGVLMRWFRRNDTLLRTRTRTHVVVAPRFWHAFQWWLAFLLDRVPVRRTVVRSRARAAAWLAAQELKGARPSPRG